MNASLVKIGGKSVRLSNLDKPLYPSGFTKAQVIDYYVRIAPFMLPHLKGRPVSFKRYPNGTQAPFFFQKNRPEHAPAWIKSVIVHGKGGEEIDYCLIDDVAALAWAANSAALELHVPLARARSEDRPDLVVFDLDPGQGTGLLECARLALRLRERLEKLNLKTLCKTSGSKGLHVYIPLNTATTFEKSRAFARSIALQLQQDAPAHVTATMARNQRGGKVFVDWNQNARHQTTVCAYSLRATASPSVSTPLSWPEVERAVKQNKAEQLAFTPQVVIERVERLGDLFAGATLKQRLPRTAKAPVPSPEPDPLQTYQSKRDFTSTPEPRGRRKLPRPGGKAPLFFCVQKHWASHLHYDFRLEHNGVLLSWAVPKGPSLRPADKRLAMRVEDHPLDYGDFEGVIPTGYGAGTVMLWDRGGWVPEVADVDAALEKGELKFSLEGVKLKGSWVLVRTRSPERDDGRSWLLIKHRDDWSGDIDITQAAPLSVKSFGDFADITGGDGAKVSAPAVKTRQKRAKAKKAKSRVV